MRKYEQHKDTPPEPLYIITYTWKKPYSYWDPIKVIRFQTEAQYQSWLQNSYATAQAENDVEIAKRNDVPPKQGREYNRYIKVIPN